MRTKILLILGCFATLCSAQYGIWGVPPDGNCVDPIGRNGQCITIQQCPTLLALLREKPLSQKTAQFLREAQCGFEGRYPKVCCSQSGGPPNIEDRPGGNDNGGSRPTGPADNGGEKPAYQIQPGTSNHPNLRLLPINECGLDTSDKIWGGRVTAIDEFPWVALFQYQSPTGTKKFLCSGVIINKRYILTAAHCLHRIDVRGNALTMIRLGEFDTTTNPDCEKDLETGKEACAPEPQDMKPERIIIHPQYSPRSINKWNDIGLIRLNQDIKFTDYVKPVCLPLSESTRGRYSGETMVVAGWGRTQSSKSSNQKMKIELPVVDNAECQTVYQDRGRQIGEGQMCAGGEKDRDSCTGDSGAPLMMPSSNRFSVAGIVSYGPEMCGKENWPGVYTRVSMYTDWILDQLAE